MYTTVQSFVSDWGHESSLTLKVLRSLNEEQLHKEFHPKVRSLGRLSWHIAKAPSAILSYIGVNIPNAPGRDAGTPATAQEIIDTYAQQAEAIKAAVGGWNDAFLMEVREIFGMNLPIGAILSMIAKHEIHHRGELLVVMRLAGLTYPGIYGPTAEEEVAMRAAQSAE